MIYLLHSHPFAWDSSSLERISCSGEGMSATETRPDTSYLLRKLHSLSGLLPVGAFLAEHFWSNSAVLVSPGKYDAVSRELQTIPFRPLVEFAVIVLPILFHGGYGIYIWLRGKSNVSQYPWVGNWMYTLQRYTGLVAFVFIGWHFYTERLLTGGRSTYETVYADLLNPLFLTFFAVGILCSSFHLGVGIWNFLCKWGFVATARAQRAAGQLGAVVGITFSLVGILILIGFRFDWHPFASYITK
jgi:succinate dehydrogenase / fumarate reductase cytochrome b subunit